MWTNDPLADFHRYSSMQEDRLSKLPICCKCDEPIQSDAYKVDGEYFDFECLWDFHMKHVPMGIKCCECGKHIQDEESDDVFAYNFDTEWICDECMEENHRIRD